MNVQLRLMHDKSVQHRISAPCTGEMAKALGKCKLEEQLPGLLVKFVSYQEAEGKPEQSLADDQPVSHGSILNFSVSLDTVLKQQRQHNMLLKGLYRGQVLTVISKYSARFLKPPVSEVGDKAGVARFLTSDPQKAAATAAALVAVGATMTAVDFAQGLDATCTDRNSKWPSLMHAIHYLEGYGRALRLGTRTQCLYLVAHGDAHAPAVQRCST